MIRLVLLVVLPVQFAVGAVLLDRTVHLGVAGRPEWSVFEGRTPEGTNLVLTFDAPLPHSAGEQTLIIRQDDVKQDWLVTLNEKRIGRLVTMEAPLVHTLPVPAGLLKERENRLEISARAPDDILIREVQLVAGTKEELFSKHRLKIEVRERGRAGEFPCRITIEDARGELAAFYDFGVTNLAARPGVIYTASGQATIGLRPGEYTIVASRGPEYGIERKRVRIPGERSVRMEIAREVDTTGWISSDTHIHTLSLSRHGDALLHERVITLAAEAIDLPIVTEHNLHADYAAAAREMGVGRYFTTVPGNEVTTRKGHFNIFPVSLSAPPPDHTIESWPELFAQIRRTPDVQVAILNHPTDMHAGFVPFAGTNLNLVTGRNLRGEFDFEFDGMEVINSGAMNSDWMAPFRAWFALLNRGQRITAVASSDSHDVSRFIVGQGRTYIRGDDSRPGAIDVRAACENLKRGRAVVSLGIFPQLELRAVKAQEHATGPGDLFSWNEDGVELAGSYAAPSWIAPNRAVIYANGRRMTERQMNAEGRRSQGSLRVELTRPKHDTYYVLIVEAPGVTDHFWATARPYQPSSIHWTPVMIGATNPVWLDADGNGKFTSPREYALQLIELPHGEALARLREYDWAVAAQFAELLHERGVDLRAAEVRAGLPRFARDAFDDYLASLPSH